jgi:hypothetical protein
MLESHHNAVSGFPLNPLEVILGFLYIITTSKVDKENYCVLSGKEI